MGRKKKTTTLVGGTPEPGSSTGPTSGIRGDNGEGSLAKANGTVTKDTLVQSTVMNTSDHFEEAQK